MEKNSDGIVINKNIDDFQRYKLERLRVVQQKTLEQRVQHLQEQLNVALNEIAELKNRIN